LPLIQAVRITIPTDEEQLYRPVYLFASAVPRQVTEAIHALQTSRRKSLDGETLQQAIIGSSEKSQGVKPLTAVLRDVEYDDGC